MKEKRITAYLLRVDECTGVSYKGYLSEVDNDLKAEQDYVNYGHPHGLIDVVALGDIDIIVNDEGLLLGYPVNRLCIDDEGNPLSYLVGNLMCVRHNNEGEFTSILPDDIPVIEKYLKPVIGGKITCMDDRLLPEYEEER